MSGYSNSIGDRIKLEWTPDHGAGHAVKLSVRNGWNDSCPFITSYFSVNELHDLRYLIDRAITAAESPSRGKDG